jgi:hypothetical protein
VPQLSALNGNVEPREPQLVANYTNCVSTGSHRVDSTNSSPTFPIAFQLSPPFNSQCTISRMTARDEHHHHLLPLPPLPFQRTVAFWYPLAVGHRYAITLSLPHSTPPSSNTVADFLPGAFMVWSVLGWRSRERHSRLDPDHPLFASDVTSRPGY